MSYRVCNRAVKISLMQTVPGMEFAVAEEIEDACTERGLKDYAILKGFGSFDLVFIYEHESFESVLIEYGPIQGLLKTSRYFAFELDSGSTESLMDKVKKDPFTVVSLLKISPEKGEGFCSQELEAIEFSSVRLGFCKATIMQKQLKNRQLM